MPTTAVLTSSVASNLAFFSQPVTLTATVATTGAGTPGGVLTFYDGTTPLAPRPNAAGVATLTTSSLGVGGHPLTAFYAGDSSHLSATSASLSQTVAYAVSTAVTSSAEPDVAGQLVTFTDTLVVTGTTSARTRRHGPVLRRNHSPGVAVAVSLVGGQYQACYAASTLSPGSHSITAVYSGGGNFTGSISTAIAQPVIVAVTSYHNDASNDGQNNNETILTPANVNASDFGKLYSTPVDGRIYAAHFSCRT